MPTHPYTREQLSTIYEKLPQELKEAMFSMETADLIRASCEKYGISDSRLGEISALAGDVLMGLTLPSEFQGVLEQNIDMPQVLAEAIAKDINRLVFYPVKPALEQLHDTSIGKKNVVEEETPALRRAPQTSQPEPEPGLESNPQSNDSYREPLA